MRPRSLLHSQVAAYSGIPALQRACPSRAYAPTASLATWLLRRGTFAQPCSAQTSPRATCRSLARFRVDRLIGRGYASRVYAAHDTASSTPMALKVYRKAELCPLNVHQIKREMRIHSALAHPSVLALYAAFEDDEHLFMALEFCAKGDLYNYLKSKGRALSETQARFRSGIWPLFMLACACMGAHVAAACQSAPLRGVLQVVHVAAGPVVSCV